MNFNDPKVIKSLLGQGLTQDSASAVNPDSEGNGNPRKQAAPLDRIIDLANQPHWKTTDEEQKIIHQTLRSILSSLHIQHCPTCNEDLIGTIIKIKSLQGSGACGPSAPVDEAVPKEKEFFSTHLKRTGDFIEPADY